MKIAFWPFLLSLTLLAGAPACAKKTGKPENTDNSRIPSESQQSNSTATTGSKAEQSGNLDDLLDGKIEASKPLSPAEISIPEPKVETPQDILPESAQPISSGRQQLQYQSDESEIAKYQTRPIAPARPLQATVRKSALTGRAEDDGYAEPMNGQMAPTGPLHGNASESGIRLGAEDDPDSTDRELMIEWDRWRNRFLRAIQMHVQAEVNHPEFEDDRPQARFDPMTGMRVPRFPLGTETWFDCEIGNDHRIKRMVIVKPSGHPDYDQSVYNGVYALDGTSVLQFPSGSHRRIVKQKATIRTSDRSEFQYHHFGDVERYRQSN